MAEKKPSNREQVKQIVAGIEGSIQELFQSERYAEYLRTMSRFHTYSVNNTILIHIQMPNATHVAGYNKWKNQFGRHVKQGEKGLTIIAPTPFKKKIEEMKLDPDTKAPVLDEDGNAVTEEREIEIPLFKPVKVFDVSQTEGAPLPSLVSNLTGNVEQYEAFMEALRRTSPMSINVEPLRPGLDGLCNHDDQIISIQEGMSQVQTVCATVHEITHAVLHSREKDRLTAAAGDETKEPPKPKDENTMEVEAESVSYTVCQYYGIETGANSLGYIATWSKDRSLPELKASLETICKTASALISSIDRHFVDVCKERGIGLTAQQTAAEAPAQETPSAPELPDTPERFMGDMMDLMDRLYAAGAINRNFPPDGREEIKAEQVRILRVNPALARAVLEKFVREDTGAAEAGALLERLDKLVQEQEQPLQFVQPEQEQPAPVAATISPPDELPDTTLDEYPVPDDSLTLDDLIEDSDLLPLPREQAMILLEQDMTVYMVEAGKDPAMVFEPDDIMELPEGMMLAVPREEWEQSPEFRRAVLDRMQHQEERERAFLNHGADCFAIYQVKDDDALRDIRFESLDWLKSKGRTVERGNYDLVYTASLSAADSVEAALDQLWYQFNNEHPTDFQHPSMSVSDIIALNRGGVVTCHYCDSFGFAQLPDFLTPKPTVAKLEAQVKAGQTISLTDLAGAVHREKGQKKSVVAQLKGQPKQERKKAAPKKSAEKEI